MLDIVSSHVRDAIDELRREAARRRETTPSDVASEAFEFAAKRVETALAEADRESERLTPAQYAALHRVTQQTVTRWIRVGELEAEDTANGYLIAREAKRMERRKAS
jgi:hypothetical protein